MASSLYKKKAPFYGKKRAPSLGLPVRVVDCGLGRPAAVFGEKQNKKAGRAANKTKQNKTCCRYHNRTCTQSERPRRGGLVVEPLLFIQYAWVRTTALEFGPIAIFE